MGQHSSYYLYQKYVKYGSQDWLPVYPYAYSIDAEGTMPLVIKLENDTACGYVPPELYRWVNLDPATDFYCTSCGKISGTYGTGNTAFSVDCSTATSVVTSADTSFSNVITYANIGSCVDEIGPSTFRNQLELTGVTIPNTVETIGASAFTNCQSMIDCMLPDSVTSIGNAAFSGCVALNSFVLWDNVTSLGTSAFTNCDSLISVNIPSGLNTIPNYCFDDCGALSEVTIPSGVTSIGTGAFRNCRGLMNVTALPDNPPTLGASAFTNANLSNIYVKCNSYYSYILDSNWSNYASLVKPIPPCETPPLPTSMKYLGFYDNSASAVNCSSSPSSLTSGETRASLPYSGLTKAIIGECVNELGSRVFYGCKNLNDLTISTDNITSIGSSAFTYCSGLTSVNIPTGVTSIGSGAFWNCNKLTSVTVPDNVTSIGSSAFRNCTGMTSATLGSGITSIGSSAFMSCYSLQSCNIPSGVTSIEASTFSGCDSLTSIHIPSSVTSIGQDAFSSCDSLLSCTFEENSQVESIGKLAFYRCPLNTIDIPDSVETIDEEAFYVCTSLTSVTIGSGVTSIGDAGFWDCTNLHHITCKATTPPTLGSLALRMSNGNYAVLLPIQSIQVPCNSVDAYKAASGWSDYASKIVGDSSCYKFFATYNDNTAYTIQDCNQSTELSRDEITGSSTSYYYMTNAIVGDCVTSIGREAFSSCNRLSSCTIPNSVTTIGGYAFYYCTKLPNIELPDSITSIGDDAFYGCGSFTSIHIPKNVSYISTKAAFAYTSGVTSITVDSSNTYYDSRDNCNAIILTNRNSLIYGCKTTIIPDSVTSIEGLAFEKCSGLTSINIPDSVTTIGDTTFFGSGLISCTIGSGITSIGSSAFMSCRNLTSVTIHAVNPPSVNLSWIFYSTPISDGNGYIYVPADSVSAYKSAWSTLATKILPIT